MSTEVSTSKNSITRFRIAARALRQLGAELITSDDVALNELIKNAFDAGSPRVRLEIFAPADASSWSAIAEELRREKIALSSASEKAQRAISDGLSPNIRNDIASAIRNNSNDARSLLSYLDHKLLSSFYIRIKDDGVGMSAADLTSKFLVIGTPNKFVSKKSKGSEGRPTLGDKGIGRLSMMRLGDRASVRSRSSISEPWRRVDFDWTLFNDPDLYLEQVDINESEDDWDEPGTGTEIVIQNLSAHWSVAKVELFIDKYLRRLQDPFADDRPPFPIDVILNGVRQKIPSIPLWLTECAQFGAHISFTPGGGDDDVILRRVLKWRTSETEEIRSWTTKELANFMDIPADLCARLGAFEARCLWFNRQVVKSRDLDYTKTDVINELNLWCGGFSVYRDGFRVGKTGGMEDDWLEWDSKALKSRGFTLNRYQTVGSVEISSKLNPFLIDSANREGLVACPEQLVLKRILADVVVRDLKGHVDAIKQAEVKIAIAEESTEESLRRSEDSLRKVINNVKDIAQYLPASENIKVNEIYKEVQSQIDHVNVIKVALQMAQETRVELLELANIGLVVEIVIHELTRLTASTGEMLAELQTRAAAGRDVSAVIDNLQSQIKATNKRIRSVDVMSPSGRNRKERYDAVKQTLTITDGFKGRFKRHGIECVVTVDGGPPSGKLEVEMVRGLIAQSLENLLSNSVYWLQQGLREGETQRQIDIDIDSKAKVISVSDNGPGVDPRYAMEIFKPYFSLRNKGKGLGLYIASELIEYHQGKLYLDSSTDQDGRLRTFVIELPKD